MPPGFEPMRLERFGGLNTLIDPTNLPNYASPDCSDVEFLPGLVKTRPGTISLFTALGGNPTVNYLKSYISPLGNIRALALDSLGNFYKENPIGTLASVATIENTGVYGNSVSLFGREYLAFGDGKIGASIPRQFDDTNFDRVSQIGPGASPAVQDETVPLTIVASPGGLGQQIAGGAAIVASPNGATQVGNIVTITMTNTGLNHAPPSLTTGDTVQISGVGVAGYNGTFPVLTVSPDSSYFTYFNPTAGLAASGGGSVAFSVYFINTTVPHNFGQGTGPYAMISATIPPTVTVAGAGVAGYNGTWNVKQAGTPLSSNLLVVNIPGVFGLASSGNGTMTINGNIVAGVHQVSVVFVTRSGYVTAPAPVAKYTAAGGKRAIVTAIPTGPTNVTQRILVFTGAGGQSFFYISGNSTIFASNTIINDNTTTSLTVDFSDAILLSGVNVDALFNLLELGECLGVTQYSSRLFWWGERNKLNCNGGNGFTNLTFDGGWAAVPSGFTFGRPLGWANLYAGSPGEAGKAGPPSSVFGDAFTVIGSGTTGASALYGQIFQGAYQDTNQNRIIAPNVSYSVRIRLTKGVGTIAGTPTIDLFSATSGVLGSFTVPIGTIPSSGYAEFIGTLVTPQAVIPTDLQLRYYVLGPITNGGSVTADNIEIFPTANPVNGSVVRASKASDPESYDGVSGFLIAAPSNGQATRNCFVIRDGFYIVKERSLFVTSDDGVNEPSVWTIQEISQKVGTPSARGVGLGDEWAIIAGLDGVYHFDGGEPQKISQEIQPTWDAINWNLGHLIDVKVDTKRKRVYIAVPYGASATANNRILTLDYTDGFGDPNPTNTVSIAGLGRKWSPWAIACNSMNLILRADGSQRLWFGNNAGNNPATGKIYELDTTGTVWSDDGVAINSYWQSGYFQDIGRLTFGPVVVQVTGSGTCNLIARKGAQGWLANLRGWGLSTLGFRNMERNLNIETERLAVRFGTNAVGSNFSLQGVIMYVKPATWGDVRGINTQ